MIDVHWTKSTFFGNDELLDSWIEGEIVKSLKQTKNNNGKISTSISY